MTRRGQFIVVEGLEGAGKSTAIKTIKHYLEQQQLTVMTTREPGGTRVGELVRQLIKEKHEDNLDPRCELLLLYAARVQLIEQIIKPALTKGDWVIADRFELSSFAYQGSGRELGMEMVSQLSKLCLQDFAPDLVLYLDIDPTMGLVRAQGRGALDRIEQESMAFFHKVYQGYLEAIKKCPHTISIDASEPEKNVQLAIINHLSAFISHHA